MSFAVARDPQFSASTLTFEEEEALNKEEGDDGDDQ